MRTYRKLLALFAAAVLGVIAPTGAAATPASARQAPVRLVAGLQGGSGSTVGPDGALYVTEGAVGRISRIDPRTGRVTTFASGLPPYIIGIGGAVDVAFLGRTAYVLVTLVGPRRRRQRHRRHLPGRQPTPLHRRRGHRRLGARHIRRCRRSSSPPASSTRSSHTVAGSW